jgi:hypothetical protein
MSAKISDKDLRRQALNLKNAYEQPGLTWSIPEGIKLLDIINIYEHEEWPVEKVWCVNCTGRHHKRGFTALLSNGMRVLLGSSCGQKVFGESWVLAERRMRDRADRQWELERLDRLALILDPLVGAVAKWQRPLEIAAARRSAFTSQLSNLASRVIEAATIHQGALVVYREIDVRVGASAETKKDFVPVKVADLPGHRLFRQFDVSKVVDKALSVIKVAKKSLPYTDNIPTNLLRSRRKAVEEAFTQLELAAQTYRAAQAFFTPKTFALLVQYTDKYAVTDDRYYFNGNGIDYDDGRPGVALPHVPLGDLNGDPFNLIAEYRAAD